MSSGGLFYLVVPGFIAIFGLSAWWSWTQAKKRRELLAAFAKSEGWSWVARDDQWTYRFTDAPFGEGDNRKALNVLQGAYRGHPIAAFDYSYETHSSDANGNRSTTTHRYAVCALALPGFMPRFELTPEGRLGHIGTMLGMQDIELESEDFNRKFRVRCTDAKLAYDVLPARTMQALLARPALHIRLHGTDALCWESGAHSPAQLLARLDSLHTLVEGIPAFVWSDLKGNAS